MRGVHESVNLRAWDDFLKVDVPVTLIKWVVLAGHDQQRDLELRQLLDEFLRRRAGLMDRTAQAGG